MILDEILETKRGEIEDLRARRAELADAARRTDPPRNLEGALGAGDAVAVIAEFKRRSPSAGSFGGDDDAASVARGYAGEGAAALSVLTDGPYFGGSLYDLRAARGASPLPVLRKDFVIHPLQLLEARAAGADAVLLIARALEEARLAELVAGAAELGMDALVEVHDGDEMARALGSGARIVGVNARDLATFDVDLGRTERLLGRLPGDRVAVAESGIGSREDVERMARAGADAVLVGGWLMRRGPEGLRELVGVPRTRGGRAGRTGADDQDVSAETRSASASDPHPAQSTEPPDVKICGLRRADDVRAAARAGAAYAGFVLAPSPRRVESDDVSGLARLARDEGLAPVGVFVDASEAEIVSTARKAELEVAQLHGDEPPDVCRHLREAGLEVWKAIRPRSREELRSLVRRYGDHVDRILVEGFSPKAAGGTGTGLPHAWLDDEAVAAFGRHRLVLAGGLTPENVGQAIRRVRPGAVDVSSGVERAPGEKGPERIRAFVRSALAAEDADDSQPEEDRTGDAGTGKETGEEPSVRPAESG